MRTPRLLIGTLLVVTALGCNRAPGSKTGGVPPPATVIVADVIQRTVPLFREHIARTEAVPTVELRARVPGVLEQVLLEEGRAVTRGQTLFVIQRDEYAAALLAARAQLAKAEADVTRSLDVSVIDRRRAELAQRTADLGKAEKDVARFRPLADARAIPQQDLDTSLAQQQVTAAGVDAAAATLKDSELERRTQVQLAEAARQAARAAVTQAELNLGYTTVQSPIDGIAGKVAVDRGNLVGKGEPTLLATVSAVDPIYVDFAITEIDYLRFAPRIRLDRPPDDAPKIDLLLADGTVFPHKGRVVFIDRAIDPKTGTITVRAAVPNPARVLRPGLFARVRYVVEQRTNAVLVPQRAVQEQQGARAVLVVDSAGKVVLKPVRLDERFEQFYIVLGGVVPGERVIVEGMQKVRPGTTVKAEMSPTGGR